MTPPIRPADDDGLEPYESDDHGERRSPERLHVDRQISELRQRVKADEKAIAVLVQTSVVDGIRAAVADPATWDAFFAALALRAQNQAGAVATGGLKWLLRRVFWGLVAAGAIYAVGGWTALGAWLKTTR